jgi:DNA-binding NarL/FixJ family response regulator
MTPSPTRVLLVDDHPLVREWLGNLLRLESDMQVVGEAETSPAALACATTARPNVAVVDLSLKQGSGFQLIRELRSVAPTISIVVLSMHEELSDIERAFRAGAMGYVTKRESTKQIVEAIRSVHRGEMFANPATLAQLSFRLLGRTPTESTDPARILSDQELEVFRRLGTGQSTREISEQLGVSQKTVQTYCARIKDKLAYRDGAELARSAFAWHQATSKDT